MALILHIDTALEKAAIGLSDDDEILASRTNETQFEHAAWLHTAIQGLLRSASVQMKDLAAVSVTSGPGSYTGLRVGMSAAKGLCYALQIPMITESTLFLTASAVKETLKDSAWICPMIDARRMEVFAAMYDESLQLQAPPSAVILEADSFREVLDAHRVVFCGNGSAKWKRLCEHPHANFSDANYGIEQLIRRAIEKFSAGEFTDIAWSEPDYLKPVYMTSKNV